jgi:hypothetical protein
MVRGLRWFVVVFATFLLSGFVRAQEKSSAARKRIAIRAGRLIDGKNDAPIPNALILAGDPHGHRYGLGVVGLVGQNRNRGAGKVGGYRGGFWGSVEGCDGVGAGEVRDEGRGGDEEGDVNYPAHLFPCLRFAVHLAVSNAKLGAEWIATPFS